jgi:hypothetical protein
MVFALTGLEQGLTWNGAISWRKMAIPCCRFSLKIGANLPKKGGDR